MASVCNDPGGRKRILFIDGEGMRRALRLGEMSQRQAEVVRVKVEDLVAAAISGHAPAEDTSRWLTERDDRLYNKLAKLNLVKARESVRLKAFIDAYIDGRVDIKPRTKFQLERVRGYLLEHFTADIPLRDITPGDAEAWRLHLVGSGRATNTIRRAIGRARQFFAAAIRKGLIRRNPFEGIAAAVKANHERFYFVTREQTEQVIEACPDVQWRLIVALARYGGLRCPSEVLALTWDCIDWEHDRIRVPSPKTAHHEGGASRVIPLFPELRPHLHDAYDAVPEGGSVYCITRYRDDSVNLRTQLHRIIRSTGAEPWEKPFQNMRSTRETELAQVFPLHVVCRWIGNSQPVASKHYLQLTDEHFAAAVAGPRTQKKAAQNPAQKVHENTRNDQKSENVETLEVFSDSAICDDFLEPSGVFENSETHRVGRAVYAQQIEAIIRRTWIFQGTELSDKGQLVV